MNLQELSMNSHAQSSFGKYARENAIEMKVLECIPRKTSHALQYQEQILEL